HYAFWPVVPALHTGGARFCRGVGTACSNAPRHLETRDATRAAVGAGPAARHPAGGGVDPSGLPVAATCVSAADSAAGATRRWLVAGILFGGGQIPGAARCAAFLRQSPAATHGWAHRI